MDVQLLQHAAKVIEIDGDDGIQTAAELVGMPTAIALLIAHYRYVVGSAKTYPPDPEIDKQVIEYLVKQVPAAANFLCQPSAYFYTGKWYCLDNFSAFVVWWRGCN